MALRHPRERATAVARHHPEPRAVPLQRRGHPSSLLAVNSYSFRVHSPWSSGEGPSVIGVQPEARL